MPVVLGNGGLQGGIHRGQQIPQLIDEAGQHCPGVGRNQFVEPGRDHPPGALHHKLHQKRPGPQRQRAAGESPQRDHRQRQQGGAHNRFAPANLLRQRAEENPADDRGDVVAHRDNADRFRLEAMLDFQKDRVEILRPVGEEVKGRHQHHQVQAQLPVATQHRQQSRARFTLPCRQPDRGLLDAEIDKRQQQHWGGANDKHPAPAELCKQQPVGHGRQQIAERIPRLEQTGHQAARAVRDRLHRQRRSHAPDPAHRHAVQYPQQKKQHQRRRRGGEQLKGGEENDVEHQDRFAAKLFRRPAEDQRADRPHGKGQQNRQGDLFKVDVKRVGDIAQ